MGNPQTDAWLQVLGVPKAVFEAFDVRAKGQPGTSAPANGQASLGDNGAHGDAPHQITASSAKAEAVLQKITITPANPTLSGPMVQVDFGHKAPQQQFKAEGLLSDGSKPDVTRDVEWSTSDSEVVAIDQYGLATLGFKGGTATISVRDRAGAAQGAGIGGSTKVTVTIPVIKSIVITPNVTAIAAGEQRQFKVTWLASDGRAVTLDGDADRIAWSSSADALVVDAHGHVSGKHGGSATLTATDKKTGLSTTLSVAVTEHSKQTPFGTLAYFPTQEAKILPALNKALAAYADADKWSAKLTEANLQLIDTEKQVGSIDDMKKDIENDARLIAVLAEEVATNAQDSYRSLQAMIKSFKILVEETDSNMRLSADDVRGAKNLIKAEKLIIDANEEEETFKLFAELVSSTLEAEENPTKAVFDSITAIFEHFHQNKYREKAETLQKLAHEIAAESAETKFKHAQVNLLALGDQLRDMKKIAKDIEDHQAKEQSRAEAIFDDPPDDPDHSKNRGNFSFQNLTAGIELAKHAADYAKWTQDAASGVRDAANALLHSGIAPEAWMANPQEGQRIIQTMTEHATGMFNTAALKKEYADSLLQRFQEMYKVAKERLFAAPGKPQRVKKK